MVAAATCLTSAFTSVNELMRLSLIGTVHAESGLANAVELLAILERLAPNVIFAETPSANLDQYSDGSHGSLESIVVARYRESHHVTVIPVDLPKPEDAFFRDAQEMFDKVERTSAAYRRMVDSNSFNTRTEGFPYLNSDRCIRAWTDIYGEVLDTIDWIGDPRLREIYNVWDRQNELRETEMVKNIADYAGRSGLVHGAFLVGVAHRKSIMDKARVSIGTGILRVEWELDAPFLERA